MKIAIQGGRASFHEIATRKFFEGKEIETIECDTFRGVCEQLVGGDADYALLAIENSIAGSILGNYALMREHNLNIVGEVKLRIKQNLMALPGQKVEDLKKVRSHYMALLQCQEYLSQFPHLEEEQSEDTADSAKAIREGNLSGVGAIAGEYAAEIYDLEILGESIETIKQNYTRFFVLSTQKKPLLDKEVLDKATIWFELPNEVGSLAKALKIIVDNNINLTKIQSLPIVGKPDQYTFYVDCIWGEYTNIKTCLVKLREFITDLTVLGEYKDWKIEEE
ncbi:MAG: prephenate dehydratase [Cytophagales bacterium]|nr:prephenate dehydratase [Cytophagales bacterium]